MADFTELKAKHKVMWGLGEYDVIAEGLHPAQDHVVRVARPRVGEKVLDVATGTGNTAIKARELGATVTGFDLSPELLGVARKKAEAAGHDDIRWDEGDAARLPYPDGSFDVVLSTCGHMFAPDHAQVASEMARVTRPGGRIVFMAWTPTGGLGGYFQVLNRHVPPPAGVPSPFAWGDEARVRELLGPHVKRTRFESGDCTQFGATPEAVWDTYRTKYGPAVRAYGTLAGDARTRLDTDMLAFLRGYVTPGDHKLRWGREYLLTEATR